MGGSFWPGGRGDGVGSFPLFSCFILYSSYQPAQSAFAGEGYHVVATDASANRMVRQREGDREVFLVGRACSCSSRDVNVLSVQCPVFV